MNESQLLVLNIGELIVTTEQVLVSTTLGSCVSVCLLSSNGKVAGIIHFALPYFLDNSEEVDQLRYGDRAIPILIDEMLKKTKGDSSALKAKVIGGANCFIRNSKGGFDDIGQKNIKIAKDILRSKHIEIVGEHTGGEVGRKVIFHAPDGRLQVASLKSEE